MCILRVFSIGSGEHISHEIILHTKFSKFLLTRYFLHCTDINLHLVFWLWLWLWWRWWSLCWLLL
jgi:hypothetical protein